MNSCVCLSHLRVGSDYNRSDLKPKAKESTLNIQHLIKEDSTFYNIKQKELMRNKNRVKQTTWGASTSVLLLLGLLSHTARSGEVGVLPALEGIGYYEQTALTGVNGVSLAGGGEIVIYGQGMSHTPSLITALFSNPNMGGTFSGGAPKAQDIAFSSHTDGGKFKYSLPSPMQIHSTTQSQFDSLEWFSYEMSLVDYDSMTQQIKTLKCGVIGPKSNCNVYYYRSMTPILYHLSPPVVYLGSDVAFWIDPKSSQDRKSKTLPELPWTEVRLNGYGVDFEGFIEEDTVLPTYTKVQVRGKMGGITPNSSVDVIFRFRVGYALHMDSMLRCSYDNSHCYKAKAVAKIDSISANTGYQSGGQVLTVQGHGFNSDNINVKVDGIPCQVIESDVSYFKCLTGPQATPTNSAQYVGQSGLRRKFFNTTQQITQESMMASTEFIEMLAMDLEAPQNVKDGWSGNIYSGYFKAPATAKYRFYVSCDDDCTVRLSTVNMDPSAATLIYTSDGYTTYRNYLSGGRKITNWFDLNNGEHYYIEVRHIQRTGGDHVSVAVEIEDPNIVPGHQHTTREVQRHEIRQLLTREMTNITIDGPDGGEFSISIMNPKTLTMWSSGKMNTNMTENQFYNAVKDFYAEVHGAWVSVTRSMYLDDGETITTDVNLSKKNIYTIYVMRSLANPSTTKITVSRISTSSVITPSIPSDTRLSNPPLSGFFRFKCQLQDGVTWNYTQDMNISTVYTNLIRERIVQACPQYRDKLDVLNSAEWAYNDDSRDFYIRFVGSNKDEVQMTLEQSLTNPVIGDQLNMTSSTSIAYNPTRIMYEPVPFEFLYTAETTPQVIVSVDGLPAVCNSLSCGYTYVAPVPQITAFSHSGSTLAIDGTAFPAKINSIGFAHVECANIVVVSPTQITCTVTPVAGNNWSPIVTTDMGLIPLASGATLKNIPLVVSGVTPTTDLNPHGGTILTLSGNGMPQSLANGDTYGVTFSGGNKCQVISVAATQIRCITEKFPATGSVALTLTVNGIASASQTVSVRSEQAKVTQITPSSVSPVIKGNMTLTVTGFTQTLSITDLEVSLVSAADPTKVYAMNVIEVDTVNKAYIKVRYGCAESGTYKVVVRSKAFGNFDTAGISVTTQGKVTDFNPKQGSIHGGTLITITGSHFSTVKTDNPVRIGYTDCLVESTTPTEIQCRTLPKEGVIPGPEQLVVFLRTFEEAVCAEASDCMFTWVDTAKVASFSADWVEAVQSYVLSVSGSDLGAAIGNTEVYIDEIEQEVIEASASLLKVKIVDILSSTTANIDIYLPSGTPDDSSTTMGTTGFTLAPRLQSVSPNTGSIGGSLIVAQVPGLGVMSSGYTLTNQAGEDICFSKNVTKYGQLECLTDKNMVITNQALKLKVGTTFYTCTGAGTSDCDYQTSDTMLTVSAVANPSGTTVTLTGTGFQGSWSGFTAMTTFNGVLADSVSITSDTEAVATFSKGVPLIATALKPYLYFQSDNSPVQHWATSPYTAKLTTALTATALDSSVSCSFAGGCSLTITQPGLLANLASDPAKNTIRVCGQRCELSPEESSSSQIKCKVPALPTTYSIDQYKIISESYLMGTAFSSNSMYTKYVWDGSNQHGWDDRTAPCHFGTAFRVGYIGVINEVKYFMNRFKKSEYIGTLRFEGSHDGTAWTTVFTVGQEIHEGWNYYNYAPGQELRYRFYRFYGSAAGSCVVGEVSFRGYEVIDSTASTYTCKAQLMLNGVTPPTELTGDIIYENTKTALLKSISPRFGSVMGGETITFNGENFSNNPADYTVLIDGKDCAVSAPTATSFQCVTSSRPGLSPKPTLEIKIAGRGNVATQGLIFRYVNYWSEPKTWGGDFAPLEGDMVHIPKGLNLLVDVDSTPILSAVVVEGSLIFPSNPNPNHLRTFDAHYVLVRGGLLEVGTEQFPYTSKLVITMHSNRSSPELPIFGNKVIAMYNGVLDLHGVPRVPTWTELDVTADIGSSQITLIRTVDWQVGEKIVIAPTGYFNTEAEERTIQAITVSGNKATITLDQPLQFKHFAGIQYLGAAGPNQDFIEMRAEVGLLSRNIMYRGDPVFSNKNEYGAHIMVHSNGMENLVARIEYVHFYDCGQAFQLGRYPIHFHLIGAVHNSYIKGNAIHRSYNRACTIHGVHYLRITENVAYNTKGHTFFIEDAAETKNYLEKNLAILTKKSWSLLNSDQTPASFWITHPDNIFRGNHAAGSDNYGYWFDTKPNPTGPSFDPNICPENSPLGEFSNNVAHSNGRYGLRVFHKLIPRTFPCMPIVEDPTKKADPYWQNPLVPAVFSNFTSFKNRRNGAIALDIGEVRFENFKVADNILAGIEVELSDNVGDGYAMVHGAIVIGRSDNADFLTNEAPSHGIIGPRTENFQLHNVRFYNFDIAGKAAIGTCSHCFADPSTDSGARTLTTSRLSFENVSIKIRYQEPWREIIYDQDGTLTGLGAGSWATAYWRHNEWPGQCSADMAVYDGLICKNTVQVRRVVFYNYKPDIFSMMNLNVYQYDQSILNTFATPENKTTYLQDTSKYSSFPFRKKTRPMNSWAIPVVTGHTYRIHWQKGLDFEQMQVDLSPHWKPTDANVYFVHNFTDVRAKVEFLTGGDSIKNTSLLTTAASALQMGANVVYNATAVREMHFLINGKNETKKNLVIKGYRCDGSCLPAIAKVNITGPLRLWSDPKTWPKGVLPKEGEDVEVPPGMDVLYDLEESPIYRYVQINGRTTFKTDAPKLHLRAKYVFVRAGELHIGNETNPFEGLAQITLYGDKQDQHIVYDNAIEAGNKILANTGILSFWGVPRPFTRSRLLKTGNPKDTTIQVEAGLSWKENDTVALPSTNIRWSDIDFGVIKSYDNATGVITLDRPLSNYHWGSFESTAAQYSGVDMRGEVMLLTRNIKVKGNDTDDWGCQIVTSDFEESNNEVRAGETYFDNVEIHNCSQYDTYKAALRFEGAKLGQSKISNSAIHHGLGMAIDIEFSENVVIKSNNIFSFYKYGINIMTSKQVHIDGNWVFGVHSRNVSTKSMKDTIGAILACAHHEGDKCFSIKLTGNVAASVESSGVDTVGFAVPAHECGDYTNIVFKDNIAHSIAGNGVNIYRNFSSPTQGKCLEASYFAAYKCKMLGIVANQATHNVIFSNMVLIDNHFSAVPMVGLEGDKQTATMRNMKFYGETEARDCQFENICLKNKWAAGCIEKNAIMPSSFANHGKPPMISAPPAFPQYKIKADASFGGSTLYENIQFISFKTGLTWCGVEQRLFRLNPSNADYYPAVKVVSPVFNNVAHEAIAYFFTPPNAWAVVDDCGNYPCTGPNNVLIQFQRSTFTGSIRPLRTEPDWQAISGVDENSGRFPTCKRVNDWNGYYCNNPELALVTWESLDEDKMTRLVTPIEVTNSVLGTRNVVNTFMDHMWDGFYTSMKRLSRFASMIQTGKGMVYDFNYKSTPPKSQKVTLRSDSSSVTLRIKYPKAGAYILKDINGKEIIRNAWDTSIQAPGEIRGSFCGENRYVGVVNILEFFLTRGCTVFIEPIDSIQSSVRMNWTMSQFFADGGTTTFADRVAASLGIKPANIKVVSVYEGSVIVDFQIIEDAAKSLLKSGGLEKIQQVLVDKLTKKTIILGAPILNAQVTSTTAKSLVQGATTSYSAQTTTSGVNKKPDEPQVVIVDNSKPQPVIITNTTTVIREVEEQKLNYVVVIAVVSTIIGLILAGGLIGYCFFYRRQHKPTISVDNDGGDHNSKTEMHGADISAKGPGEDIMFEDQYHPKAVVDIFGLGGDVIAKANQADEVIMEDDCEDEQSSQADQPRATTMAENLVTGQHILYTETKDIAMQEDSHMKDLGLKERTRPNQTSATRQDEEARHDYVKRMAASSRLSSQGQ